MIHRFFGKEFEIRVIGKCGQFLAIWVCLSCLIKSLPLEPRDTADDAVSDAIADLEQHVCPGQGTQRGQHHGNWWLATLVLLNLSAGLVLWVLVEVIPDLLGLEFL